MAYDKNIFDRASKIISARRAISLRENAENKEKLFTAHPILRNLENELAKAGLLVVSDAINHSLDNSSYEKFKSTTDDINAKISKVLAENSLPNDALKDKFDCSRCEDTGFDGKNLCSCIKDEMQKLQSAEVNKISPLTLSTFDNFSLDYYDRENRDLMSKNLIHCKNYIDNFDTERDSLLFVGNTGLGKTHLSLAIANSLLAHGKNVLYTSWLNILTVIERERFQNLDIEEYTIDNLIDCELLIIDDLGAEFTTQFSIATLYNILNSRINYRRPTIINTNLSFKELGAKYGDRIVSRIAGNFTALRFCGDDIRIAKLRG